MAELIKLVRGILPVGNGASTTRSGSAPWFGQSREQELAQGAFV
jgi:hypothetical protein